MAYVQPTSLIRGTHDFQHIKANQFLFSFDNDPIAKILCKSAGAPSINNAEIPIAHFNKTKYTKGKTTYDPISITLYDYINPSTAQLIMSWQVAHAEGRSGRDGYDAMFKRDCTLEICDPLGSVVRVWRYYGCFLTNANFGEFNWDTDSVMEIPLSIRYDDVDLIV
jgi:hypothetical protein